MEIFHCALLVLMVKCVCSNLDIDRNEKDTTYGSQCWSFPRTTGWFSCTCKAEYTTMMSKENEVYNCFTPKEVGCDYSLTESKQAYLVTTTRVSEEIIPKISETVSTLPRILVWNLHPDFLNRKGNWVDVTGKTAANFSLNVQASRSRTSLIISNMNVPTWRGLVIKADFGGHSSSKNCVILKVKGTANYPIDIYKRLGIPRTTTGPPTVTRTLMRTVGSTGATTPPTGTTSAPTTPSTTTPPTTAATTTGVTATTTMPTIPVTLVSGTPPPSTGATAAKTTGTASPTTTIPTTPATLPSETPTRPPAPTTTATPPSPPSTGATATTAATPTTPKSPQTTTVPTTPTTSPPPLKTITAKTTSPTTGGTGAAITSIVSPTTTAPLTSSGAQRQDHYTVTTVGIIVGVILAIVVAVIGGVTYHRRKAVTQMQLEDGNLGMEKLSEDLSVMNGAYEIEQCDKESYCDPNSRTL